VLNQPQGQFRPYARHTCPPAPGSQFLHIDPFHFGVIVVVNLMIGLITPPLGLCLFVVCGVAKVEFIPIVKGILPFLMVEVLTLFLITYFPWTALAIPQLFGFH